MCHGQIHNNASSVLYTSRIHSNWRYIIRQPKTLQPAMANPATFVFSCDKYTNFKIRQTHMKNNLGTTRHHHYHSYSLAFSFFGINNFVNSSDPKPHFITLHGDDSIITSPINASSLLFRQTQIHNNLVRKRLNSQFPIIYSVLNADDSMRLIGITAATWGIFHFPATTPY